MDIQSHMQDEEFLARLSGRMMFSDNPAFRVLLDEARSSGAKRYVFDLSELASVDSAGLGMFLIAAEQAKKSGLPLTLCRPSGQVKQLLALARFDKLVAIQE